MALKASQLIEELQKTIQTDGDLSVWFEDDEGLMRYIGLPDVLEITPEIRDISCANEDDLIVGEKVIAL